MNELKPCPFCGGTVFTECLDGGIWPDYMYNEGGTPPSCEYVIRDEIMCDTCGTSVQSCSHSERLEDVTPEEAQQNTYRLWNTRVDQVCHNASYRIDESRFHCSECGFGCWVKNVATGREELPNHCPNCGAKVVE